VVAAKPAVSAVAARRAALVVAALNDLVKAAAFTKTAPPLGEPRFSPYSIAPERIAPELKEAPLIRGLSREIGKVILAMTANGWKLRFVTRASLTPTPIRW
jgi:hypothetical protein